MKPGRYDNETQHLVTISQGFWMGETAVTQKLWTAVMGEGNNPSRFQDLLRPVEQVSWDDAQEFIHNLNGLQPGLEMRLPTEAQWEYACRAGTTEATYAGPMEIHGENNAPVLDYIAWYGGNSGHEYDLDEFEDSSGWPEKQYERKKAGTRRVGTRRRNPWGLQDMLGNVWEWCADYYDTNYGHGLSMHSAVIDPRGPAEGTNRVLRGGSWSGYARFVRAALRDVYVPSNRGSIIGFRLARGH